MVIYHPKLIRSDKPLRNSNQTWSLTLAQLILLFLLREAAVTSCCWAWHSSSSACWIFLLFYYFQAVNMSWGIFPVQISCGTGFLNPFYYSIYMVMLQGNICECGSVLAYKLVKHITMGRGNISVTVLLMQSEVT